MEFLFAANASCKWLSDCEGIIQNMSNLDKWTMAASATFIYSILIILLFHQLDYTVCNQRKLKDPRLTCVTVGQKLKTLITH